MELWLWVALALAMLTGVRLWGGGGAGARVTGSEAHRLVEEGALLVDVRSPMEFRQGHLEGAVNVPVGELGRRLAELPMDRALVFYCASGARSRRARQAVLARGRADVHDLGPMHAWPS